MSRRLLIAAISILIGASQLLAGQMLPVWLFPAPERGPEPRVVSAPQPGKVDELARFLLSQGYTAVPLEYLADVHIAVQVTVGGMPFRLVVDTGSPFTCLDPDRAKDLKLEWLGKPAAKGNNDLFDMNVRCTLPEIKVGGFSSRGLRAYCYNAALWNDRVAAKHYTDGVLGTDVLYPAGAIIDLPGRTLYLKKAEVQSRDVLHEREDGIFETAAREFKFPLIIDPDRAAAIDRLRFFVSDDRGKTWKHNRDYEPGAGNVIFKAPRDGEYWFALQVALKDGGANPADLEQLTPAHKVRVGVLAQPAKPANEDGAQRRPEDLFKEIELLKKRVEKLESQAGTKK
jgi:Aspartyl protease